MKRTIAILRSILVLSILIHGPSVLAQTKYWIGGNGQWDDPANWSLTANGPGGAGVPRANENVVIAPTSNARINIRNSAWCRDLNVNGDHAGIQLTGPREADLNIAGSWRMSGNVHWVATGPVQLIVRQEGVEVDTRGKSVAGDIVMDGSGSWSVISDLECAGSLRLRKGTLMANASRIRARSMTVEGPARKELIAGEAVFMLDMAPDPNTLCDVLRPGSSTLVVNGQVTPWGTAAAADGEDRDVNVCGTGPGQTPFTVNAQLVTNYNGFGVRCRGNCNATVSVSVTGGSGNFTYQWLNGGPPTASWVTACGGPQLVVVTDVGQGISCPAQVNVTEPAPVGVIFFGQGTPPTCAGVCNGTRTALAIGGVSPHTYNWNNGAGMNPSFNALCAGSNTLRITDANLCTFDTTFFFNLLRISPNLTTTNASCNGICDGTATVAPSGGTGAYTITWTPPPPMGQGTTTASGLCAGNYSVNVRDANNCDTTVTFMITQPPPIVPNLTQVNATCSSTCNGSATVMPTGAVGPFTFSWTPAPGGGQGTGTATGLCRGNYSVRITHQASGCFVNVPVVITSPPAVMVQGAITNALCATSCNGAIALTVSGGSPAYSFTWTPVPPVGQGTGSVSGLCPGNWMVLVRDAAMCDTTITYVVGAPPPLAPVLTKTDVSCAGVCNGTASVSVSGGVGPYTYLWAPAPIIGQGTPNATALCAGNYTVRVRDANNCDTTLAFVITQPPPLAASQTHTNVTCGGLCNGTAGVTVSGGTAPYTYLWSPPPPVGQGTPSASGLCAGAYNVLITDARGCTLTRSFTILPAVQMQLSLQLTPATCHDVCNGTAGVIVTGGISPYQYLWSPAPGGGQGTPNATGLCVRAYSLTVTDAVGCDTTISFSITAPPPIIPDLVKTDVTCNGVCNGTISVTPSGGNGTFTYTWVPTPPVGQGTANVSGLCAGTWTVTVASGACDTVVVVTIIQPPPITVSATVVNASCTNVCDGTASATASGGTPPLTYSWSPPPGGGQGTPNATGLCPGVYLLTVGDAAGCDTTIAVTIGSPPPILPGLVTFPETCVGPCTGSATVAPTGGTGTIVILWQPAPGGGQGTTTATGLCAGANYTVRLRDANGCDTTVTFMVPPSVTIVPNSSSSPVSCAGSCNGTATVGPTGGVAPYTYVWSPPPPNGQGTPSVSGLCAGPVQVTITDAMGCSTIASVLILSPEPIIDNATVTQVLCAGSCTGAISLNTQGGVGPYTYVWTPTPPIGPGTGNISGLCAGPRNVLITDATGCTATFSYLITQPVPLTLMVATSQSQCQVCIGTATATAGGGTGPLQYVWRNALGTVVGNGPALIDLCAGVYTLTVTDANGCTIMRNAAITDSDGEVLTVTDGATSCPNICDGTVSVAFTCSDPPCVISWTDEAGMDLGESGNVVNDLCAGDYLVSVTNASGCVSIDTATVTAPITVTLALSSSPASCTGVCDGTATVGVSGGTPPFTFTWDPPPAVGQGTPFVSGLCAGPYTVMVGDGGGCTTTAEVLIIEPSPLSFLANIVQPVSCFGACDGNVTSLVMGGTAPYTYLWSPAPATGQGTSAAFGFCSGSVSLMVTDAQGCTVTRNFVIGEPMPLQIIVSATSPSDCSECDGIGSITVIGGTGPFEFSWSILGIVLNTEQNPTDLCSGLYHVTVLDASGCTTTRVVQIPNLVGEDITITNGQTLCSNACDGEVSVSYTCSVPPCSTQWLDAGGVLLAEDTDVLTGLCNGVYTVIVFNGNGCKTIADAEVAPSQILIPNLSTTPISCIGACDGTATVGPTGGVEPYAYTWDPPPGAGQDTPMATGLCAGVYTVSITDASVCDTTIQVLITAPVLLEQQATVTDISCAGSCDGSIVVTPIGGIAPFTFLWSPVPPNGQGSNGAFDLCAGDYQLTVTDQNGCTAVNTWTVTEPAPLALAAGSVPSECGLCNGEVSVSVSGGTGPYLYLWTQGANIFGTADTITNLCAGFYHVQVIDAHGCEATLLVPMQDINGEDLTSTGDTTSCPGICDASIQVDFNCSEPPCVIAWLDAAGNDLGLDTPVITDRCAGTYYVTVTNGIGCLSIDTVVVAEPEPILPNLSTTPVTCFGTCDGAATVGPTGGVPPYTFVWDPAPPIGQGTPQAEELCAGIYEVSITDDAGCVFVVPVLILGPPQLTADLAITPITCNGMCDGSIVVTPQGGIGPYTFNWTPEPPNGPDTDTASDLCAGDWMVQVVDANGCDTTFTITLVDPPVLQAEISTTNNLCFGDCEGAATATITGGVEPYTITWRDTSGTVLAMDTIDLGNLCAGDYVLNITDANGCSLDVPFSITQSTAIEAALSFTGETCFGPCDGTAAVQPSGGTAPYDILWDPEPDMGQGTDQVSGLCAGNWTVTITDALGCDTTYAFTLLPYTPITDNAAVNDVNCNGACDGSVVTSALGGVGTLNYVWTPVPPNGQGLISATDLCPGPISLTITDAAGCDSTFNYTIIEPLALEVSVDQVLPASCSDAFDGAISSTAFGGVPPYIFSWFGPDGFNSGNEDISGLSPGVYNLSVIDANNCVTVLFVTVDALITVIANAGADQEVCLGTQVTLDGSQSTGGVDFSWVDDQGTIVGTTLVVTLDLVTPGVHTFTLTIFDGLCSSSAEVVVNYLALPIANAGPDHAIFLSETATLGGAPSGPVGSTFAWTPDSLLNSGIVSNPIADPDVTTWFVLTVVAPNGCTDTDSVLVTVVPTIVIPTGFTPNSDGRNDTWVIDFIELFPDCVVEVYNRWGEQLFRSVGYRQPWDGRYRDGYVPIGTYYYVIELNDERFPEPYSGPLTVIR